MEITRESLITLIDNEINKKGERKVFYGSEYKVTSIEQVVHLADALKDLDNRYKLSKDARELLTQVKFEEGKTFIHTYFNRRSYLKFLRGMIKTLEVIGIEVPEGKVTL